MPARTPERAVSLETLDRDPHPTLADLRAQTPVAWVPELDGWLVTRHDLALAVMRDATTFTVQDDRFTTSRVVGPSMLSLDGPAHARHRAPFTPPLRAAAVHARLGDAVAEEVERLVDGLASAGGGDLRADFAGPLAAGVMTRALGLPPEEIPSVREWYGEIVTAVTALTAGEPLPHAGRLAFDELAERLRAVLATGHDASLLVAAATGGAGLDTDAVVANAAVFLFGGVDTTEGMVANAVLHLLSVPGVLGAVREMPSSLDALIEESLRLEPAAAVIDRFATRDVTLGGANIPAGDLVRVSITATGRDPAVFTDPDRLDLARERPRRHLAFAHGPHVCIGVHLARLEARTALMQLIARLRGLRLDPAATPEVRGLVFRKPSTLGALWDEAAPRAG